MMKNKRGEDSNTLEIGSMASKKRRLEFSIPAQLTRHQSAKQGGGMLVKKKKYQNS